MEKVKISHRRIMIFFIIVMSIFNSFILMAKYTLSFPLVFFVNLTVLIMSASYIYYHYGHRNCLYFGVQSLSFGPSKTSIDYDDIYLIKLEILKGRANGDVITIGSKKNQLLSYRIELNWFTELSIFYLSKKYLPLENELRKNFEEYFKRRNVK